MSAAAIAAQDAVVAGFGRMFTNGNTTLADLIQRLGGDPAQGSVDPAMAFGTGGGGVPTAGNIGPGRYSTPPWDSNRPTYGRNGPRYRRSGLTQDGCVVMPVPAVLTLTPQAPGAAGPASSSAPPSPGGGTPLSVLSFACGDPNGCRVVPVPQVLTQNQSGLSAFNFSTTDWGLTSTDLAYGVAGVNIPNWVVYAGALAAFAIARGSFGMGKRR